MSAQAFAAGAAAASVGCYVGLQYFPSNDTAKPQPLKLILFGPPGSGKGTQCGKLRDSFGVKHISTGDVLRDHVKRGTALGDQAKGFMDKGELVPDDLMINLLKAETQDAPNGWLIDGMPRTPVQAKAMNKMGLEPDLFFTLEVPDSVLADRITLRRMDPVTGEIYNLKLKPPPPEIKSRLTQRKDDTLPKLQTRLGVYHKNLDMVKEIYKETNNLKELDGVGGGIDGVHSRLLTEMLKDRLTK